MCLARRVCLVVLLISKYFGLELKGVYSPSSKLSRIIKLDASSRYGRPFTPYAGVDLLCRDGFLPINVGMYYRRIGKGLEYIRR